MSNIKKVTPAMVMKSISEGYAMYKGSKDPSKDRSISTFIHREYGIYQTNKYWKNLIENTGGIWDDINTFRQSVISSVKPKGDTVVVEVGDKTFAQLMEEMNNSKEVTVDITDEIETDGTVIGNNTDDALSSVFNQD